MKGLCRIYIGLLIHSKSDLDIRCPVQASLLKRHLGLIRLSRKFETDVFTYS